MDVKPFLLVHMFTERFMGILFGTVRCFLRIEFESSFYKKVSRITTFEICIQSLFRRVKVSNLCSFTICCHPPPNLLPLREGGLSQIFW